MDNHSVESESQKWSNVAHIVHTAKAIESTKFPKFLKLMMHGTSMTGLKYEQHMTSSLSFDFKTDHWSWCRLREVLMGVLNTTNLEDKLN